MKIIFVLLSLFLTYSFNSYSQHGVTISYIPFGKSWVYLDDEPFIKESDMELTYEFKNLSGFQIGYEFVDQGFDFISEFSYCKGTFSKAWVKGNYNPYKYNDYKDYEFTQYCGYTINHKKRIQFPIYLGLGVGLASGGCESQLAFNVLCGIRTRIKFFLTNRLGVFAGATGKFGVRISYASPERKYFVGSNNIFTDTIGCYI